MLKDLPFYEVSQVVDSKARQARLEQIEKKRQDGTLRQAPTINCSASNSTVRSLAKKKGPVIQPVQRSQTLSTASPSSSSLASSPSSSSSAASTKSKTGIERSAVSTEPKTWVESLVPLIACEEEEDENMAVNLRTGFKERQFKHLSESITVNLPSFKRPYLEPVLAIAPMPAPSAAATSTNSASNKRLLLAEEVGHQEPGRPSFGPEHLNDDSVECVASVPSHPKSPLTPNQKEIAKLMRQIPSFTEGEAPVHNMGVLFLVSRKVSMDLKSDPSLSFVARLPFGTSDIVISRILPMQDYTIFETAKMVSRFPLLFILP